MARQRVRKNTVFVEVYYEEVARGTSWDTVKREQPASEGVREVLEKALKLFLDDELDASEVHNQVSCFHEGIVVDTTRKRGKDGKVKYINKERDVERRDIVTIKFCPADPFGDHDEHRIRMFGADGSRADFPVPKGCKIPKDIGEVRTVAAEV